MGFIRALVRGIERLNEVTGRCVAWLALIMVLVQFVVVTMRYVFGLSVLVMQESIWYMHSIIFLVAAGYTLLHNAHVRVDVLYGSVDRKKKALIDLGGVLVILLPMCIATIWLSWDYVLNAWKVREGSVEVSGIPAVYLLKTCIWLFAGTLALQGVALGVRSAFTLAGAGDTFDPIEEQEPTL